MRIDDQPEGHIGYTPGLAILILLSLFSWPNWAQQPDVIDAEMDLKPRLCILGREESRCTSAIDIWWRLDRPLVLCLFTQDLQDPLKCWRDRISGKYRYPADTDHSLTFELRQKPDDSVLVSEVFEVIREQAKYRHQRRKPWNFF